MPRATNNSEIVGRDKKTADFNEIAAYYHQMVS